MGVYLTAQLQQRGTGSRENAEGASRTVEVSAATFDDGKTAGAGAVAGGLGGGQTWKVDQAS